MTKQNRINQNLPEEYEPYNNLNLCGNQLRQVKYLVEDNGFYPILIGKGESPRIWVYLKKENKAIAVLRDSNSTFPQVKVNYKKENLIIIELHNYNGIDNNKILEIEYSKESAYIKTIDLRPIGYNLYGHIDYVKVGNNTLSNNNFSNIKTLVSINNNNR